MGLKIQVAQGNCASQLCVPIHVNSATLGSCSTTWKIPCVFQVKVGEKTFDWLGSLSRADGQRLWRISVYYSMSLAAARPLTWGPSLSKEKLGRANCSWRESWVGRRIAGVTNSSQWLSFEFFLWTSLWIGNKHPTWVSYRSLLMTVFIGHSKPTSRKANLKLTPLVTEKQNIILFRETLEKNILSFSVGKKLSSLVFV